MPLRLDWLNLKPEKYRRHVERWIDFLTLRNEDFKKQVKEHPQADKEVYTICEEALGCLFHWSKIALAKQLFNPSLASQTEQESNKDRPSISPALQQELKTIYKTNHRKASNRH